MAFGIGPPSVFPHFFLWALSHGKVRPPMFLRSPGQSQASSLSLFTVTLTSEASGPLLLRIGRSKCRGMHQLPADRASAGCGGIMPAGADELISLRLELPTRGFRFSEVRNSTF